MFSGLKKNAVMSAALLLSYLPLGAAVQVSEGKILLGNSFQLPAGSPAEFECRITNPDPRPHRVMIRLSSGYGSGLNSNSPEIVVPAGATMIHRFSIFTANDDKYTFSVFEDGVRRPNSTMNECTVRFTDYNTGSVIDKEILVYFSAGMNIDSGFRMCIFGHKSGQNRNTKFV